MVRQEPVSSDMDKRIPKRNLTSRVGSFFGQVPARIFRVFQTFSFYVITVTTWMLYSPSVGTYAEEDLQLFATLPVILPVPKQHRRAYSVSNLSAIWHGTFRVVEMQTPRQFCHWHGSFQPRMLLPTRQSAQFHCFGWHMFAKASVGTYLGNPNNANAPV